MQVVQLRIRCEADWPAGTVVDVFDDHGSGTVDLTRKLNGRSVDCYPGVLPEDGLGQAPLGRAVLGGGVPAGVLGQEDLGAEPLGNSRPRVSVWLPLPYVDGERRFAAIPADRSGNQPVGTPAEFAVTLDMEPPAAYDLEFSDYDSVADRFTFSFKLHVE